MAKKKPRGRPAEPMIKQIDASPDEIAEAVFSLPWTEVKPILDEIDREGKKSSE